MESTKKYDGGKGILTYTDKIQVPGWVKGEKKARLARSKYEKTWNVSRSPLKRLVNKALPVESERESGTQVTFTAVKKGTRAIAGPEGERQIHWDIMHTEVRRARVEECASKCYPLCDSETQHFLVKHARLRARQRRLCRTIPPHLVRSQVGTHLFLSTSPAPQKRHLEAVGNQPSRREIAVQVGVIKEGWVGLLRHINTYVYVLMKLTGHRDTSHWRWALIHVFSKAVTPKMVLFVTHIIGVKNSCSLGMTHINTSLLELCEFT